MKSLPKNSRTSVLASVIFFCFAAIVVRLFWLQVVESAKYKSLANNEQMKQYEIPASRGLIYAKDGKQLTKLVMNETVYTLFVDPQEYNQKKKSEIIWWTLQKPMRWNIKWMRLEMS